MDTSKRKDEKKENTNTISNLPLLFANGYPTSLEKITETQLVKFIPFMVQCSLGNVQNQGSATVHDAIETLAESTPAWWPDDIPFDLPLVQPVAISTEDWIRKLKELVCMCYEHHNNVFLLRFCTVLSKYEPECLRFINNYNSTTSLYDRFNNKLLVTFRNENMLYDREHNPNRICLLPRRKTGSTTADSPADEVTVEDLTLPSMVEPPLFDIYLCDYCDAELYSLEACREHEKNCRETSEQGEDESDDAVVEAGTIASAVKSRKRKQRGIPHVKEKKRKQQLTYEEIEIIASDDEEEGEDSNDGVADDPPAQDDQMRFFLSNFQLVSAKGVPSHNWPQRSPKKSGGRSPVKLVDKKAANDKRRGGGRNDRNVLTLQRCATVPLTSPMGKSLLKSQKTLLGRDYQLERIERMERFCPAPIIRDSMRPRWLSGGHSGGPQETFPVTYRAIDYRGWFEKEERYDPKYVHKYKFPRRQLSQRSRELCWQALTRILLTMCRPCSVDMVRLTETDIKVYFLHLAIERKKRELMELRRADLMRLFLQNQRQLKRPPDEFIDLCSSDDEAQEVLTSCSSHSSSDRNRGRGTSTEKASAVVGLMPGPKRQKLDGRVAAVVSLEEDETKENQGNKSNEGEVTQFVKILPKPSVAEQQSQQRNMFQQSNQITSGGGQSLLRNQSTGLQRQPGTDSQSRGDSLVIVKHGPAAAQHFNLWPGNLAASPLAASSSSLAINGTPLMVSATGFTAISNNSPVIGQPIPSSYLFLTKQQLMCQQLEATSSVAATQVVQGNEIEREVIGGGGGNVSQVDAQGTEGRPEITNSSLMGRGSNRKATAATVIGEAADLVKSNQSSTEEKEVGVKEPEQQLPSNHSGRTNARKSFSARSSGSQSLEFPGPRLRRTSACETSFPLPKKMPSLIRIAPTISGE